MAGLLQKERKGGDYHKTLFQATGGAGRGREDVGSGGSRRVYEGVAVSGEMELR